MRTVLSNLLRRLLLATRPERSQSAARIHLPAGSILRADGPVTLRCTHGSLWITQSNDSQDHLLSAGQQWHTARPGRIVVQALTPATLTLRGPATHSRIPHFLLVSTRSRAAA